MRYFSGSTKGFYDTDIYRGTLPHDAVQITVDEYEAAMSGQSEGNAIEADKSGKPITVKRIPADDELDKARKTRAEESLKESDIVIIRCYEDGIPVPSEWKEYRQALRDMITGKSAAEATIDAAPAYPSIEKKE